MYLFTITARVNPRSKVSAQCLKCHDAGGAYVSCFISFKDADAAEKLAKLLIRAAGWIPEGVIEASKVQKHQMRRKMDRFYYSVAIKEGSCLIFHTWPKDAPDADTAYKSAHIDHNRRTGSTKPVKAK